MMKIVATAQIDGPEAKGKATIVELNDGRLQLQLSNFWVAIGAPDVRIVLSKDPNGKISEDTIRFISMLPDGNFEQNFPIEHLDDFDEMQTVIVYCKKYFAHFGHGTIIRNINKQTVKMTTRELIINQFKQSREFIIHVMHGITPVVNNRPEGFPVTIGARMAHIGSIADMMIVGAIGGQQPLSMGDWKDKTGYTIPYNPMNIMDWAPKVEMEIHAMHQYILAVMGKVDEVLDGLSDDEILTKKYTLGPLGEATPAQLLMMATNMMYVTAGEISTLRIVNGLSNGYPDNYKGL